MRTREMMVKIRMYRDGAMSYYNSAASDMPWAHHTVTTLLGEGTMSQAGEKLGYSRSLIRDHVVSLYNRLNMEEQAP